MSDALRRFELIWLKRLNEGAKAVLHYHDAPAQAGLYSAIADGFVSSLGYQPIGFNWELLDHAAAAGEPRSAITELTTAFSNRISDFGKPWLSDTDARACAEAFLGAFNRATLTLVSNRYDGLWNPISGASVEWGFVGYDTQTIALLLISDS